MSTPLTDVRKGAGLRVRLLLLPKARRRRVAYVIFRQVGPVRVYWVGPFVNHPTGFACFDSAYMLGTRRAALSACRGSSLPPDVVVVGVRRGGRLKRRRR